MKNIFELSYWQQYDINEDKVLKYLDYIKNIKSISNRELEYAERHHIVPKCVDSSLSKEKDNIIVMSGREHFIAHKMLAECFNGELHARLTYAIHFMVNGENGKKHLVTPEDYEYEKSVYGKQIKNFIGGEKHYLYGKHLSDEHKENISKSLKGKYVGEKNKLYGIPHTEEHKEKVSNALKGKYAGKKSWMYGTHLSEETRKKQSLALKGRKLSEEHIKKVSIANTGKKRTAEQRKAMSERAKENFVGEGNPFYGHHHTEEYKQKKRELYTGMKFINNGSQNKMVRPEVLQDYLDNGWKLGRM